MTKMTQNMTYRDKYIAFWIVAALFCIVMYKASIQKTIRSRSECREMQKNLESVSKAPETIRELQWRIDQLDILFGHNDQKNSNTRSLIIEKCSDYCKGVKIRVDQIKAPNIQVRDDLIIETTEIHFEGRYKQLLELVYYLETSSLPGKITSMGFHKELNKRSKTERLLLKLFIQSITKTT